jgi:hypothetical protein
MSPRFLLPLLPLIAACGAARPESAPARAAPRCGGTPAIAEVTNLTRDPVSVYALPPGSTQGTYLMDVAPGGMRPVTLPPGVDRVRLVRPPGASQRKGDLRWRVVCAPV